LIYPVSHISIKPLAGFRIDKLHTTFIKAFADYPVPVQLTVPELSYMLERRGCNLSLSFGAFDDDKLVGFTLNGIGNYNGELTAYDIGTGLIPEYRRKNIATEILKTSLPFLRKKNIAQYLLEVLQTNPSAYDLYKKEGFNVNRPFDCYVTPGINIRIRKNTLNDAFPITTIKQPDWDVLGSFWNFSPSWQNSVESIRRKIHHFTILGFSDAGHIIGYGIIENHTGDVPQIAINEAYRRNGLATTLVKKIMDHSKSDHLRIINASSDDAPFKYFAESINLNLSVRQYEMILEL
jgi:ribosomal protein S18 acetylase RimI-like enzyme